MERAVGFTAQLVVHAIRAYSRKWSFLGLFALIFISSVVTLGRFDLLPETSPVTPAHTLAVANTATPAPPAVSELPIRMEIPSLNRTAAIVNPETTDIKALDKELLRGAVRYPTSAKLGEAGNMILFGHSSYLPIVGNQTYKTFNDIQKLAAGDVITVYSSGTAYTYRVRSVEVKNSTIDGILLSTTERVLTLVTCNSFGAKEERFILTADFVGSYAST